MSTSFRFAIASLCLLLIPGASQSAEPPAFQLTIETDAPGKPFSPTMHGVFFEDINFAADGGLYAELVQNRSFEHDQHMHAWSTTGEGAKAVVASEDGLHSSNPHYAQVHVSQGGAGLRNTGYDGFAIKAGDAYRASLHCRRPGAEAAIAVVLVNTNGEEVGRAELGNPSNDWRRLEMIFTAKQDAEAATLVVLFDKPGEYHVDMVSLFPCDTFRGRKNGLRKDLAQKLADLKPGFVRFPGGCIVEGRTLDNAYRWKDTVGPVWQRKQNRNLWSSRTNPHYYQTYGLGFFEFFQFCEDIGAEAVPIVNCGMACQARNGAPVPMSELGPWVQDALDLMEFANGPVDSKWGKLRAEMGRPAPFNLKYLGVGNEQWMEGYFDRYLVFHSALKQKYPDLAIISTSGPGANDPFYRYAWNRFQKDVETEIVDEHYYRPPQWFLSHSQRYDQFERSGPKVFAGEFAAHEPDRASTLRAAVSEAAFMTGLWRNADVVTMSSYAPLFARQGSVQWAPDLIWFDNHRSYGTPSYYVQAMYGQNLPDIALPVSLDTSMLPPPVFQGRIGLGTWLTQAEFKDVTVTQGDRTLYESDGSLEGWELHGGQWSSENGVLRQTSEAENVRAFVGDPSWSEYTLALKARKLVGKEGFLVSFASMNSSETSWWNLGGWSNTEHGLEAPTVPQVRIPGQIESGRWYAIKIEVRRSQVNCFLDGQLVQQAKLTPTPEVFAAAGWDAERQQYVVAVANSASEPRRGRLTLGESASAATSATQILLASGSPIDENSFDEPKRVSPIEKSVAIRDGQIDLVLPAWSFSVVRAPGDRP